MAELWGFILSVPGMSRLEFQVQVGVRAEGCLWKFLFRALH